MAAMMFALTVPRAAHALEDPCARMRARIESRQADCRTRCSERSARAQKGRAIFDLTGCEDVCRERFDRSIGAMERTGRCQKEEVQELDLGDAGSQPVVRGRFDTPFGEIEADLLVVDGEAVFEGDIVVGDVPTVTASRDGSPGTESARSVARSALSSRWPNGTIPFAVSSNLRDPRTNAIDARVTDAMNHWTANTPIRFVARTTEADYVVFRKPSSNVCQSKPGRQGGVQYIDLGPGCNTGSAIHEIGHAVGLWHEQARSDRDANVIIKWDNIKDAMKSQFQTYVELGNDGMNLDYFDFDSIMLYPSFITDTNFVKDTSKPAMTRLDGTTFGANRTALSRQDIASVRFLYRRASGSLVTGGRGCVEFNGWVPWDRTPMRVNSCNGFLQQLWTPREGYVYSQYPGTYVVDMPYATEGAGVWIFHRWDGPNQRFDLSSVQLRTTAGYCAVVPPNDWKTAVGTCGLSVAEAITGQYSKRSFTFTPSGEIKTPDGRCLDVMYWSTANGTPVVAATCQGGANQKWRFGPSGQIIGYGNKCLDVRGWDDRPGTALQMWDCLGGTNQAWTVRGQLRNPGTNMCLNAGSAASGTPVTVSACSSASAGQKFDRF